MILIKGGAWPFLVRVLKRLVYSDNERDLVLLTSSDASGRSNHGGSSRFRPGRSASRPSGLQRAGASTVPTHDAS